MRRTVTRRRLIKVVIIKAAKVARKRYAVGSRPSFAPWVADDLIAAGFAELPGAVLGRQVSPGGDHAAVLATPEPEPEKPRRARRKRRKKEADSGDGR